MGRQQTSFSLWGAWNERLHMFNNADARPPFKRSPDLLSSFRPITNAFSQKRPSAPFATAFGLDFLTGVISPRNRVQTAPQSLFR
jgi:hypothetical protein